jgi:opacity protein-like surface antigen
MKKYSALLIGICAGALSFNTASAQANRAYLITDVGGVLTSDTTVTEFFGPVAPNTKVKFDPGFRFGVAGGYRFTDWFSLEGETGMMGNKISSITGAAISGEALFSNVPFLANVRLQLPRNRCPVTPYIGGGLGGSASVMDVEHHIDLGGVRMTGSDSTIVFAYQAFAGLQFRINDHMSAGVAYHYFATGDPSWEADSSFGTSTSHLRLRGAQSHAITATFEWRF